MNARLIKTTPEASPAITETCAAVGLIFLETSGRYFDLQIGAMRSSLDSFRAQIDLLSSIADGNGLFAGYAELFNKSIGENRDFMCKSLVISADTQRQYAQLIDQSWLQIKDLAQQAGHKQQSLAAYISKSLGVAVTG